jgi:hypothetical protein
VIETRAARLGAAALAYALLALAWAAPSSLVPTERVPNLGDPLHLGWVVAWDAHQLVRRPWALFESNSFYPYPHSLAFADHLLPEAVLVAPVFWATGNAVLAYNVAVVLALTLSAMALFLLAREVGLSATAAFLGGLVYAFNSFTQHEVARVHVLNVQWWPLALVFLDRFARQGRARDAAALAGFLLLQALSGTYYLVYTLLVAPVWMATAWLAVRRRPSGRELRALALSCALAGGVAALVLWPYAAQFRAMGFEKSWAGGADLLSFVSPGPRSWLWAGFTWPGVRSELPHFVGLVGGTLMVGGAALTLSGRVGPRARPIAVTALVTAAAGVALALGPLVHAGGRLLGPGPYGVLYRVLPVMRGMAGPERVGILAILGGAVLAALAAHALLSLLPRWWRMLAAAALIVLLPLEHWSRPRPPGVVPAGGDVPPVYSWLAADGTGPVVELPVYPFRARRLWAAYLYFSTYHWRPIPLGRTSFYPPAHEWLAWGLRDFPDALSLAFLDRLALRTVVVHPRIWDEAERPGRLAAVAGETRLALRQAFDQVPAERFAALGLGEEHVYALAPGAPPAPPCVPQGELAREAWALSATGVNKPDWVVDGDARTAWRTAVPQRPGDRLEVDLGRLERVAAAALDIGYPHEEFGRNLVLAVDTGEGWRRVPYADGPGERLATLDDLLQRPREARMVLRIEPQPVRRLRLMVGLREEDPGWPRWSIPELRLFSACP